MLGLLQKVYSLGFTARRPPRGKAAPSRRLAFAQIKPTKINLSLFGRWFQLNGGMGDLGVRAHNLGKPNGLGACMIDSKGNVRPEGMFNRVRLASEARRAYDTRGVVIGDVLKQLAKQERPQRLPQGMSQTAGRKGTSPTAASGARQRRR